jgi:hypothetical protein
MRMFAATALFATFVSIANLEAQSLAEHGAAAAGATIGTAAGKPISNAVTKIFGQTEEQTKAASKTDVKVVRPATTGEKPSPAGPAAPAAGGSAQTLPAGPGPAPAPASARSRGTSTTDELTEPALAARRSRAESRRTASRLRRERESAASIDTTATLPLPSAAPAPVEPVVKEPTPEQVADIQVGASESDVVAALGVPASRVTIPDDDGHLRETYQYWAKGSQIGTVRLDNGYVVKVEARRF